jgi:HD-GYP domain-containing protein (c-di-GMP phosphodiesterase class II)
MHDGGGYPTLHYCRTCHSASRLAHVCDVYDALRTHRPYREAWSTERVLGYIEERAGTEFDPDAALPFVRMMRQWEQRVSTLEPESGHVHTPAETVPAEGIPQSPGTPMGGGLTPQNSTV